MLVEISKFEFAEKLRKYNSCSLSIQACDALFAYVEELEADQGQQRAQCLGDWAIVTCEYSLNEFNEDHDTDYDDWSDVDVAAHDLVSVIPFGNDMAVTVSM